jgi:hypothetical protein
MGGVPPATVALVATSTSAPYSYFGYPAANNPINLRLTDVSVDTGERMTMLDVAWNNPDVDSWPWFKIGNPVVLVGITEANAQRGYVNNALVQETAKAIQDFGAVSPVVVTSGAFYHRILAWDRVLTEAEVEQVYNELSYYLKIEKTVTWGEPEHWGGGEPGSYIVRTWSGEPTAPVVDHPVAYGTNFLTLETEAGSLFQVLAVNAVGQSVPVVPEAVV